LFSRIKSLDITRNRRVLKIHQQQADQFAIVQLFSYRQNETNTLIEIVYRTK